jgi:regulator of nucleoside diphosphate kinase
MQASNVGDRKLTELDFTRLMKFTAAGTMPQLVDVLDEADIVAPQAMPADVVTMYSRFVIRDLRLQRSQTLVVCYPADADASRGYVSVLSPAGMALVGQPVGAVVRWVGAGGRESVVRVERILFQPEATGDYVT